MKRILILLLIILLIPFKSVYADDEEYTDWSPVQTNFPGEQEAIQYGVIYPIWSPWDINPLESDDEMKIYERSKDFGENKYIIIGNTKEYFWDSTENVSIHTWHFDEPKTITYFLFDVDCGRAGTWDNYVQPSMQLLVNGDVVDHSDFTTQVIGGWEKNVRIIAKDIELKTVYGGGDGRNFTHVVNSYIRTELIKYSHVIGWEEPTNWRFGEPYEDKYGADAQKATSRKVYRHLKPKLIVEQKYLYEDSTYDDIKALAKATDADKKDISEYVKIKDIKYDDVNIIDDKLKEPFDPYKSDTIHVTYIVKSQVDKDKEGNYIVLTKNVKLYILRNGEFIDLKIDDRYIDSDFIYTINKNSNWFIKDDYYAELNNICKKWKGK